MSAKSNLANDGPFDALIKDDAKGTFTWILFNGAEIREHCWPRPRTCLFYEIASYDNVRLALAYPKPTIYALEGKDYGSKRNYILTYLGLHPLRNPHRL